MEPTSKSMQIEINSKSYLMESTIEQPSTMTAEMKANLKEFALMTEIIEAPHPIPLPHAPNS